MTNIFDEMPKTPPPDVEQFEIEMARKELTMQRVIRGFGITSLTLEGQVQQRQAEFQQIMENEL